MVGRNNPPLKPGQRIRLLRVQNGITLKDLAEKVRMSEAVLLHIERGREARPEGYRAIADALGVPLRQIVTPTVSSKGRKKSPAAVQIRSKTQVVFYSKLIINALEDTLSVANRERHHNRPPPDLVVDDENYLQEVRNLVAELKLLNSLLQNRSLKVTSKKPVVEVKKHLNTFLNKWAGTVGVGAGAMTLATVAALLHQLGMGDALFEQLQKKMHLR